ncbi:MAG: radical SAM family heme chaperone HemW [Eubacterium sp.]|nr:radical SAM family heme chaperone HemW [Eubacterium sp.]
MKELMLYVHIPFCVRKCSYCDFLSFEADEEAQKEYINSLQKEIQAKAKLGNGRRVSSIFFGGGTPSVCEASLICGVLETIKSSYRVMADAEITIEMNPGTVTMDKMKAYFNAGFNRISIGLQAMDDALLKTLGRIHSRRQFEECLKMALDAGFHNINVDLMMAIPGQSTAQWEETLKEVAQMNVTHISAYSLIVEENTPFYEHYRGDLELQQMGKQPRELPAEETERLMYHKTLQILKQYGYQRYEISNYAKEGYECRHNIGYWIRREYVGFGLGAASLYNHVRRKNTQDMKRYLAGAYEEESETEYLTIDDEMGETMMLGLRLTKGVCTDAFYQAYGVTQEEVYGAVNDKLKKEGLLTQTDKSVCLTQKGFDLANYCMAEYL